MAEIDTKVYYINNGSRMGVLDLNYCHAPIWVNANTDGTSDASLGVSSLTDVGVGLIGVNFNLARNNADFVAIGCCQIAAATFNECEQDSTNLSATRSDFYNLNTAAALTDPTEWNIFIIGHDSL